MVIGILLSVVGIGALCWLLFTLAVYALPFFVGVAVGLCAYDTGAGFIGASIIGVLAGAAALIATQILFAAVRSTPVRVLLAFLFAAPAAVAGYHATLGIAAIGVPSETWQQVFAVVGGLAVGVTAIVRLAIFADPPSLRATAQPAARSPSADLPEPELLLPSPSATPRLPPPA